YSQRPAARSRTSWVRVAAMRSVNRLMLLQRPAGLRVHQVQQEADAAVVLQLGFLLVGELIVLILRDQLVHAIEVALLETDSEPGVGRLWWQVIVIRADQPRQDGDVAGVGNAGFDGHKSGTAGGLRNG